MTTATTTTTLARIADKYWIVRSSWATVLGVVVQIDTGMYSVFTDDQPPAVLANIAAVIEYVGSSTSHHIDYRLDPETVTRFSIA